MYTIIFSIVVAIFLAIVLSKVLDVDSDIVASLSTSIFVLGIILGLFFPISGFEARRIIYEIDLIQFSSTNDYSSFIEENCLTYSYNHAVPEKFYTEDEVTYTIVTSYVIKYINDIYIKKAPESPPKLIIYEKKAICSKWTFALLRTYKEYVFLIP